MPVERSETFYTRDIKENWKVDDLGNLQITRTQDADPVLREVKALRDAPVSSEMKAVAQIPVVVYEEILQKAGFNPLIHNNKDEMAMLRRALDSGEYDSFKIWTGRLGKY